MKIEDAMQLPIDSDMMWGIGVYGTGVICVELIRQSQGEYYSQTDIATDHEADTIADGMVKCWAEWKGIEERPKNMYIHRSV